VWLAWVQKGTEPQSSHRVCHTVWAAELSQEPRGIQGWLKVTQWPAGSKTGPEPSLQLHPQTQICWGWNEVGRTGLQLGSSLGTERPFFLLTIPLPALCQAAASRPADQGTPVPAPANMCAFSGGGGGSLGPWPARVDGHTGLEGNQSMEPSKPWGWRWG
jgi:hypothetical protein